jgi:microcystin-dependent protein
MSNPFLGEIRTFSFNFPPKGWAMCNGQTLPINQNQALFSLLGTTYGGNGTSTFQLPNLQSRVPIHFGSGFAQGLSAGSETTSLTLSNLPAHNHTLIANNGAATTQSPVGAYLAVPDARLGTPIYDVATPTATMAPATLGLTGGGVPISNIQPYLCVNLCIAMTGIFPSRN